MVAWQKAEDNKNQVTKHNGTQPQQYNIQKKKQQQKTSRLIKAGIYYMPIQALVHREPEGTQMLKAQRTQSKTQRLFTPNNNHNQDRLTLAGINKGYIQAGEKRKQATLVQQ